LLRLLQIANCNALKCLALKIKKQLKGLGNFPQAIFL
jgi:hypothetical protein